MLFRQILHEDLSCASYLVGDTDTGVAAVIDPQWSIEPYLRLSRLHGVRIEHVLETHNHADHVSGHGRLARATGATIHVHELADAEYPHEAFTDGWRLDLGRVEIEARPHSRAPPRAHLIRASRCRPRRRSLGGADRGLAVRRRRGAAGPGDREARGRGRNLPLPARQADDAPRRRRGLARAPGRLRVRQLRHRPQVDLHDRLRARAQPGAAVRDRGRVRRGRRSRHWVRHRPTSSRSSRSTRGR